MPEAQEFYKYFGLYAFIIAWAGMLTTVFTQGRDRSRSISLHAAASKKTFYLLAILSPISMTMFMLFAVKWMVPALDLPSAFIILSVAADSGYILAAWVPAAGGIKGKIHDFLAYGASLLLIPISLILATTPAAANLPRIMNALAVLLMLSIFVVMASFKQSRASHLYFQIAYFLAFDFGLLAAAYIR